MPLVTATNSAQPPALPLTTPPQTPLSAVPPVAGGSGSVTVLGKREDRESQAPSEQPRDGASGQTGQGEQGDGGQPVKKRRVAPTLVSSSTAGEGNGNGS